MCLGSSCTIDSFSFFLDVYTCTEYIYTCTYSNSCLFLSPFFFSFSHFSSSHSLHVTPLLVWLVTRSSIGGQLTPPTSSVMSVAKVQTQPLINFMASLGISSL